jgi:hypothetical protein
VSACEPIDRRTGDVGAFFLAWYLNTLHA